MMKALAVCLSVILVALVGFFIYINLPQGPKYEGPIENIRIGNIGEFSIFNIIAKDQGFFKEYGLDADITEYESGPPAVADLLAGKVDVAVAADFVGVRNIFTNPDLRVISQASKHKVFHVIARRDKKIIKPSDLKNKKIGVTKKSAGEFHLGQFLISNHLKMSDVILVDLPPLQMIDQLKKGTLDAVVIFDPHAYNIKRELGDNGISWSAQNGQYTYALLYSTAKFIEKNPEVIKRYVKAMIAAEDFTKKHPTDAQNIIMRNLKYDPIYILYMWQNFNFAHGLDQELLLAMEEQGSWLIDNKLIEAKKIPNYLDFIYFDALESVKPQAITIIH